MSEFLAAAFGFPAALFTAALLVVIAFWLLVALGVTEVEGFDGDADLGPLGLGGVPVAVAVSVLVSIGWFTGLTGSVLLRQSGLGGVLHALLAVGVLLLALVLAWTLARLCVRPLAKLFPDEPGPSRLDFIGLTCVVRTGRVDMRFGQAEVAARDGSSAVVQVRRQSADGPLTRGSTALLYAYDDAGEFFWVSPYDSPYDDAGL